MELLRKLEACNWIMNTKIKHEIYFSKYFFFLQIYWGLQCQFLINPPNRVYYVWVFDFRLLWNDLPLFDPPKSRSVWELIPLPCLLSKACFGNEDLSFISKMCFLKWKRMCLPSFLLLTKRKIKKFWCQKTCFGISLGSQIGTQSFRSMHHERGIGRTL